MVACGRFELLRDRRFKTSNGDLIHKLLNRGAFADVFDVGDGTVIKVFRRIQQTHSPVREWSDHDFIIRQLFAAEVAAYERLQDRQNLVKYVPRYFGTINASDLGIVSPNPTEPHVEGCALRLERIVGTDMKVALVPNPIRQAVESVLEEIRDVAGRINVWDCSCFIPGPRADFAVIDFALWDDWVDVQLYLEENGSIPEDVRRRIKVMRGEEH